MLSKRTVSVAAFLAIVGLFECGGRSGLRPFPASEGAESDASLPDASGIDASYDARLDVGMPMPIHDAQSDEPQADAEFDAPACEPGFVAAPEGCVPVDPPRLIAPLSTATVTSQKPSLRWELSSGTDGARVEICRDRACAEVVEIFDAAGTQDRPTTTLPRGMFFWRAYGRVGGVAGLTPTPTWQFLVGARSAPIDRSWGSTLNVNGDGYADVAVGAGNLAEGRVHVYLGSATGIPTLPSTTLAQDNSGDARYGFGGSIASAGDLNGDGFCDLIVRGGDELAYIYNGTASGLDSTPSYTLADGAYFPLSVAGAGDVNGDGFADVVVSAFDDGLANSGHAAVYYGGPSGLSPEPGIMLSRPDGPNEGFAEQVASAGDVNGDGFADILINCRADSGPGRVYLYLGSELGIPSSPATVLVGAGFYFGHTLAGAGDTNGDGLADVVIGDPVSFPGVAYLRMGGPSGFESKARLLFNPVAGAGGFDEVAGAGDINGDGFADVLVGDPSAEHAYIYFGGADGFGALPAITLSASEGALFGGTLASAGDVDADGWVDIVAGAGLAAAYSGEAYLFLGSDLGIQATPSLTLSNPDESVGFFGGSVAGAH